MDAEGLGEAACYVEGQAESSDPTAGILPRVVNRIAFATDISIGYRKVSKEVSTMASRHNVKELAELLTTRRWR